MISSTWSAVSQRLIVRFDDATWSMWYGPVNAMSEVQSTLGDKSMNIDWDNKDVPLRTLVENDYNPRSAIDDVSDIIASIEKAGIRGQLMEVRRVDGGYEVISGSRRLTALREYFGSDSDKRVPVRCAGQISRETAKWLALTENTNRSDLTPIEEARAFADQISYNGGTYLRYVRVLPDSIRGGEIYCPSSGLSDVQTVANDTGKSASVVSDRVTLLLIPDQMYDWVDNYEASDEIYPQLPKTKATTIVSICRSLIDDPIVVLDMINYVAGVVAATSMDDSITHSNRSDIQDLIYEKMDEKDIVDALADDESEMDLDEMITTSVGDDSDVSATSNGVDFGALERDSDVDPSNGRVVIDSESVQKLGDECPLCHHDFESQSQKEQVQDRIDESGNSSLNDFVDS